MLNPMRHSAFPQSSGILRGIFLAVAMLARSAAAAELTLDDLDRQQPARPEEAAAAPPVGVARAGPAGPLRVIVDPEMSKSVDGYRGLTGREQREIQTLAEQAVVQARAWLREPKFQAYFQKHYKLEPVKLLDETGMTVLVKSLTEDMKRENLPRSGDYDRETRTIRLHAREFIVGIRGQSKVQWVPVLGSKVVHELTHCAAIDSGRHWEPAKGQDDEGTLAERELGIYSPRAPEWMLSLEEILTQFPPLVD